LEKAAELPDVVGAVGLPDLHPGKGIPIGAALLTRETVYPHLVGSDIGCGMALWQTDIKFKKMKVDRWLKALHMDTPWEGDRDRFLRERKIGRWDDALGTVGGGNHFAEIQKVDTVFDEALLEQLGLDPKSLQLMIHSGSRGLGNAILRSHTDVRGGEGLHQDSPDAKSYLQRHDEAVNFAQGNRALIAARMLNAIRGTGRMVADMTHNMVERVEEGWIHRKGAASSKSPFVLIPGSRGTVSYVVKPISDTVDHGYSLAHGAGRKWDRSSCKGKLEKKYSHSDLGKTAIGSWVLCRDKKLIYEEAPEAYKPISTVIDDLKGMGLIELVVSLRPVLTYKTDGGRHGKS